MLPSAAFDRCFHSVGRRAIRQHREAVIEVFMDVSADERIHLMASRSDGRDVILRQAGQDKPVCHVNAKLVATSASAGVTLKPSVNTSGRISPGCIGGYPSSRHADVDKTAFSMPDRVDPGTERGNQAIWPVSE